jgi:hypothetical protein
MQRGGWVPIGRPRRGEDRCAGLARCAQARQLPSYII